MQKFLAAIDRLNWLEHIISFLFRLLFILAEPLLAFGIIVTVIDSGSHGSLLSNGTSVWSWAWIISQGIALESSGGVMLQYCLQSREEGDKVKAWLQGILAVLLLLCGGILFYTHLSAMSNGTVAANGVLFNNFMAFLRSLVALSYIAMCRTKDKRFSGESPQVKIQQANNTMEKATELIDAIAEQYRTNMTELQNIKCSVEQNHRTVIEQSQKDMTELKCLVVTELQAVTGQIQTNMIDDLNRIVEHMERGTIKLINSKSQTFDLDGRFNTIERALQAQLNSVATELTHKVTITLEESVKKLSAPSILAIEAAPDRLLLSGRAQSNDESSFNKTQFILECVRSSPNIKNAEIIRRAAEQGQQIARSTVSEVRGKYETEQRVLLM